MAEELIWNGIWADDGKPAFPPLSTREVYLQALAEWGARPAVPLGTLSLKKGQEALGPIREKDRGDLSKAGWGVVFAADDPEAETILEALEPLLELRREKAGKFFRALRGPDGYRPGESHLEFLERFKLGAQGPDPSKLPANLLLVGSPARIPFAFQSLMGQWYNVGRLDLPTAEDHGRYAKSVARHEQALGDGPCRVSFFGPRHQGVADKAPRLAADHLLAPLASDMLADLDQGDVRREFSLEQHAGEHATKSVLRELLGGGGKPDLLLAAAHGAVLPRSHPEQQRRQGGLICSDWPGAGPPGEAVYGAADVQAGDDASGLVAFLFACYGGGTPLYDLFVRPEYVTGLTSAKEPFVAGLPKALLRLEKGPLAVVGHVERVWSLSFLRGEKGSQAGLFQAFLRELIEGETVGQGLRSFTQYAGACAMHLSETVRARTHESGRAAGAGPFSETEADELAELWTAVTDARGYVLLGDPAVRVRKPVKP